MNKKLKSARIKPLQRIAAHHEYQAATSLGTSRKELNECEKRLGDLIQFRQDYSREIFEAGKNGISGSRLLALQQFVNQLDNAINQQKHSLLQASQKCDQQTRNWQQHHQRTTILLKTINRFEVHEHLAGQKLEQKLLDEHNQQRTHYKKS